jgi:hypothetical protein
MLRCGKRRGGLFSAVSTCSNTHAWLACRGSSGCDGDVASCAAKKSAVYFRRVRTADYSSLLGASVAPRKNPTQQEWEGEGWQTPAPPTSFLNIPKRSRRELASSNCRRRRPTSDLRRTVGHDRTRRRRCSDGQRGNRHRGQPRHREDRAQPHRHADRAQPHRHEDREPPLALHSTARRARAYQVEWRRPAQSIGEPS